MMYRHNGSWDNIEITKKGNIAYGGFFMFGLLGGYGAVAVLVRITAGNITKKVDIFNSTDFTNTSISISYTSSTSTITISTDTDSNLAVLTF